ncbi:hypothetical protein NRB16_08060 [Pseudomonas sp. LJDD11]|uniref:hypothetical protein n=1 Tax=Pseudomonas sp. LJDD11 TaxID=2931984 RepID=UPI00211BDB4E|nr:hypothetical protein [Pseudomonas sp. LJDD11]MCQ9423474.1 hypothetical protein [Pseudomonas sp. LJDD11]
MRMSNGGSDARIAIFSASIALSGVVISAVIGWISSAQSSSLAYKQACVARIDSREIAIRDKVGSFYAAQGALMSAADQKNISDEDFDLRIGDLYKTAWTLSAHVSEGLAISTRLLTVATIEKANHDPSPIALATSSYTELMRKWDERYEQTLKSLDHERANCL